MPRHPRCTTPRRDGRGLGEKRRHAVTVEPGGTTPTSGGAALRGRGSVAVAALKYPSPLHTAAATRRSRTRKKKDVRRAPRAAETFSRADSKQRKKKSTISRANHKIHHELSLRRKVDMFRTGHPTERMPVLDDPECSFIKCPEFTGRHNC